MTVRSGVRAAGVIALWLCAACGTRASSEAKSAGVVERAKGVYVVLGPSAAGDRGPFAGSALSSPATGIYLRTRWSTIEPGPERYDWSEFDRDVAAAKRAGKRLSLGIRAGDGTPTWLLDRVKTVSFIVGRRHGTRGSCQPLRIAVPWDDGYVAAYGRMMDALAAHLKSTNAYDSVTIVKLTGLNNRSEELHLPSSEPLERAIAAGTACRISSAGEIWRQAGYRPALVLTAWTKLAAATGRAFPDKLLSLPTLKANDFPKMSASGDLVSKRSGDWIDVKQGIIAEGLRRFPGRFAVQSQSLNDQRISPVLTAAHRQGALIGLQSNFRRGPGGGAGCKLMKQSASPCTPEGYRTLLAVGERAGATYLEVWPVDAARFGPQIAESVRTLQ